MAKSRKDSRGYVLRTGESQRKDGRYSYSYTDLDKNRRTVYAKTLVELRAKERKIIRDKEDGLNPQLADRMTLNELYDRFIEQKYDLKPSTKVNYLYMYNHFVRPTFGKRLIGKIKYSDVKKFYYRIILDEEMKANTLDSIHTQLHPAFQMAVRDGLLRQNPTDGLMAEIKKSHIWEDNPRHALTIPQQKAFMDYLKAHREYQGWVPIITVLLGTGMRIGECIGLRWDDLNFEKRIISVNHTFIYRPDENRKSVKHISTPKTISGRRTIPMIDEVFNAFLDEYEIQKCIGFSSEEIDGYSNFVFVTATGTVYLPNAVNRAIERARVAYNKEEIEKAEKEDREPLIIPHFSAHHLRHTFCTRLCENESNLKVIQSIMGHSDITTTMDVYAEATQEKKQEIVANLQGKIII